MRYLILILGIAAVSSIAIGFIWESSYSQKFIGGGVAGLFFVVFPLFIYHRWSKKNFKDYMLTKENLDEMRKNENKF
ncbi:MAG: hypothetical protein R3213_02640 [Flavobacteriaceae bacterium]|nr:hypothetical protein [Flavobacteriaceae bacterium]